MPLAGTGNFTLPSVNIGEGNGNSFQYSCLENPMDRGAWWDTVYGVTRFRHDLVTKPPLQPEIFMYR